MRQAIAESCDVYFYHVAEKMGIGHMDDFMKAFGYGSLTGIDIPGEKPGLYASPEWKRRNFKRAADQVWFPGETISMGIGQGPITVTPLQQAHFAAEIAESGHLIATPRLVTASRAAARHDHARNAVLMKTIDIANADQWGVIYDGMIGATSARRYRLRGGARSADKIAGKTGTAQVFTIKQTENTRAKSWMKKTRSRMVHRVCACRRSKIAISVLVENGGFGAAAAAPIARKVLDAYLLGPEVPADSKKPVPN